MLPALPSNDAGGASNLSSELRKGSGGGPTHRPFSRRVCRASLFNLRCHALLSQLKERGGSLRTKHRRHIAKHHTRKTLYYVNGYITIYIVLRFTRLDLDLFGVINDYLAFNDIVKLYHQYRYN